MDQRYFNSNYVALPLIATTFMMMYFVSPLLERLGYEETTLNYILAGVILGTPLFIATWLVMVLVLSMFRRNKK